MSKSTEPLRIIEVAPSLYSTEDGRWLSEPPQGAHVVAHLGAPLPDIETRQILLTSQEDTKNKIIDTLGLYGDTKEIFLKAWAIGSGVGAIPGYVEFAKNILKAVGVLGDPESAEMVLLKQIAQKVFEIDKKLTGLIELVITQEIADLRSQLGVVQTEARSFLTSQSAPDWSSLKSRLTDLHAKILGGLMDPQFSLHYMRAPWQPGEYAKTPWYLSMYLWGYEYLTEPTEQEIPLLGQLPAGQFRWDYRPWLGVLAETVATLVVAHTALNPAQRTAGVYRSELRQFASLLRATARRIGDGIQVTRSLNLAQDRTYASLDDKPGSEMYYDILAKGWPNGAVDSVSGACVFTPAWIPAEHGFKSLAGLEKFPIKGVPGVPPPWPWTSDYYQAVKKAESERGMAYLQLLFQSPVPELMTLAKLFDSLAMPPKESETVQIIGPDWTGLRVPAGKEEVTVGGLFCEAKAFSADIFKVKRAGSIKIRCQPQLFKNGVHEIKYRFLLESYYLYATSPHPMQRIAQVELDQPSGKASLEVPTFHWDVEKPLSITDAIEGEKVAYVMASSELGGLLFDYYPPAGGLNTGSHPIVVGRGKNAHLLAEGPLEERNGKMSPDKIVTLAFSYERKDEDGLVTFEIGNESGQPNAMLWLVVEETIGDPPANGPAVLRTWLRLPMIGIERHWPASYFAHLEHCGKKASEKLYGAIRVAQRKGIPIPIPDPTTQASLGEYVTAVTRHVRMRKGRRKRRRVVKR